ncbi:hypothetical protein G7046_g6665 [Stylonectria norvegica]|nr:hypothetical protein G7046_g6665 [Stylonectria norvegica]
MEEEDPAVGEGQARATRHPWHWMDGPLHWLLYSTNCIWVPRSSVNFQRNNSSSEAKQLLSEEGVGRCICNGGNGADTPWIPVLAIVGEVLRVLVHFMQMPCTLHSAWRRPAWGMETTTVISQPAHLHFITAKTVFQQHPRGVSLRGPRRMDPRKARGPAQQEHLAAASKATARAKGTVGYAASNLGNIGDTSQSIMGLCSTTLCISRIPSSSALALSSSVLSVAAVVNASQVQVALPGSLPGSAGISRPCLRLFSYRRTKYVVAKYVPRRLALCVGTARASSGNVQGPSSLRDFRPGGQRKRDWPSWSDGSESEAARWTAMQKKRPRDRQASHVAIEGVNPDGTVIRIVPVLDLILLQSPGSFAADLPRCFMASQDGRLSPELFTHLVSADEAIEFLGVLTSVKSPSYCHVYRCRRTRAAVNAVSHAGHHRHLCRKIVKAFSLMFLSLVHARPRSSRPCRPFSSGSGDGRPRPARPAMMGCYDEGKPPVPVARPFPAVFHAPCWPSMDLHGSLVSPGPLAQLSPVGLSWERLRRFSLAQTRF